MIFSARLKLNGDDVATLFCEASESTGTTLRTTIRPRRSASRRSGVVALLLLMTSALLGPSSTAHAQAPLNTWDGGGGLNNGSWNSAVNWGTDVVPTAGTALSITFGATTGTTILNQDIAATFLLNRLTFTTGVNGGGAPASYTIGGGDLRFEGTAPNIVVSSTGGSIITQTIASNLLVGGVNGLQLTITGSSSLLNVTGNVLTASNLGSITLTLAGTATNGASYSTLSGVISDSAAGGTTLNITKSEAGNWQLTGQNTFSGNVSIWNGSLVVGSISNSGAGNANALGLGSTIFLGNGATGGVLALSNGTASSAFASNKNIVLSGSTGGGEIDNNNAVATSTLLLNGSVSVIAGVKTLTLGGSNIGLNELTATVTNGLGTLSLFKAGTGTWVVSGDNAYTGGTTVSAGTLILAGDNTYTLTTTVLAGATLQLGNGGTKGNLTGTIQIPSGAKLLVNRADIAAYGSATAKIVGAGTVEINGGASGGILFNSANTYTGTTTITRGTLRLGTASALAAAGVVSINTTGTLDVNGQLLTIAGLTDGPSTGGKIINNATAATTLTISSATVNSAFSGTIQDGTATTGTITLIKAGAAALTLGGSNTYSGQTSMIAGTLVLANSSALGTGTLHWFGGTIQPGSSPLTVNNPILLSNTTLSFGGNQTLTLNGNITSSAGTVTLSLLNTGGVVLGGNFSLSAATAVTRTLLIQGSSSAVSLTVGGVIQTAGLAAASVVIQTTNGSQVTLLADNTYTGVTSVIAGARLNIGNGGTAGSISSASLANAGAVVFNRSDALTYAGVISGAGAITYTGGATFTIGSATVNAYTGATTIGGGSTFVYGGNGPLGNTPTINILGSGTILTDATPRSLVVGWNLLGDLILGGSGSLTLSGAATSTLTVNGDDRKITAVNAGGITFTGINGINLSEVGAVTSHTLNLSGTGALTFAGLNPINDGAVAGGSVIISNTGAGVIFNNANTYTGTTTILALATLNIGGTMGSVASNINLFDATSKLIITRSNAYTYTGILSGAGSVTFSSPTGIFSIGSVNTYSGTTSLVSGTVQLGSNGALGTGVLLVGGGNLQTSDATARSLANNIVLLGNLGLTGTAALTLGGNITVSGGARQVTVSNVNASGTNTWNGTVFLGETGAGQTLTLTGAAGSNLVLNGTVTSGTNATGGSLAFANGGNFVLNGNNGYTGGTTLAAATLIVGNNGALGTGTLAWLSGTLQADGSPRTLANDVYLMGATLNLAGSSTLTLGGVVTNSGLNATVNVNTANGAVLGGVVNLAEGATARTLTLGGTGGVTVKGVIQNGGSATSGTLAITNTSAAGVTLLGANTFNGATILAAAATTLRIGDGVSSGNLVGPLSMSGAKAFFNNTNSMTYNGVISGSGSLSFATGTYTLGGANIFIGSVTVGGGATIVQAVAGPFGTAAGGLTIAGSATLQPDDTARTFTNAITALNGDLTLAGNSTFTLGGAITVSGGNRSIIVNNGSGNTALAGAISLSENGAPSGRVLTIGGTGAVTITGVISDNGGGGGLFITNTSSAGVALAGANTFNGMTTVGPGAKLVLGLFGGGATGGLVSNITNSGSVFFNRTGAYSYAGVLSGPGNVAFTAATGTISLAGTNSYSGLTSLLSGTVSIVNNGGFGTSTLVLAGGTLMADATPRTVTNALILGGNVNLAGTQALTFDAPGGTVVTVAAPTTLTNAATVAATFKDNLVLAESLTLGGANPFVFNGNVSVSGADRTLAVFITAGQTIDGNISLFGAGETAAHGLTLNGNSTLTLNGAIGDGGFSGASLAILGGTVALNGANTYVGPTTLGPVTVVVGSNSPFGTGTVYTSGSSLRAGVAASIANNFVLNGGLTLTGATSLTLDGTISGAGGLTFTGPAAYLLTAANSYAGGTTINASTITLGNDGVFGTGAITFSAGTLVNGSARTFANVVNFGGLTTFTGAGAITFDAPGSAIDSVLANTTLSTQSLVTFKDELRLVNGATVTVSTGTLSLDGGLSIVGANSTLSVYGTAGMTVGNINLAADSSQHTFTLRSAAGNFVNVTGVISDNGTASGLYLAGNGTITLSGDNTYSGMTTAVAGSTLTLIFKHDRALGSGIFTMTGSGSNVFAFSSDANPRTLMNEIWLAGQINLTGASPITLGGNITVSAADQRLSVSSTGAITNTLSGTIFLGENATPRTLTLATLATNTLVITGPIVNGTAGANGSVAYSLGNFTVSGNNTYSGSTSLAVGANVALGHNNAFGTSVVSLTGATLSANGNRTINNNLQLFGNLTLSGTSDLTLGGNVTLSGGDRQITNTLSGATASLNGTIFLGDNSTARTLTLVGLSTNTLMLNGTITSGTNGAGGSVSYTGGNFFINGSHNYSGPTTLGTGAVVTIGASGSLASGIISTSGGTLQTDATPKTLANGILFTGGFNTLGGSALLTLNGTLTNALAANLIFNNSAGTVVNGTVNFSDSATTRGMVFGGSGPATFNGTIRNGETATSSTLLITNTSAAGISFLGSTLYTGVTTIAAGALLTVGTGGATTTLGGPVTLTGNLVFNRSGNFLWTSTTLGTGGITFTNNGVVTFSNASTFAGAYTVQQGAVSLSGGADRLGPGTTLVLGNGVSLTLQGVSQTLATLTGGSGGGTINNAVAATASLLTITSGGSFAGVISNGAGTLSLSKGGPGTLVLSGSNSFSGGFTIGGGTVLLGNDNALGSGTLTGLGGTIQSDGGAPTLSQAILLSGPSAVTGLGVAGTSNITLTGTISLTGVSHSLTVLSTGITTLNNVNLSLEAALIHNLTITTGTGANVLVAGVIGLGAGPATSGLVIDGLGNVTLSNINTYSGTTYIRGSAMLTLSGGDNRLQTNSFTNFSASGVLNLLGVNQTFTTLNGASFGNLITNNSTNPSQSSVLSVLGSNSIFYGAIKDGVNGAQVSINKTGNDGYLMLVGNDNTYTGMTTVGPLTVLYVGYSGENGGLSGSITGPITNSGTVYFGRSGTFNYGGAIFGNGPVTLTNSGQFTFSGKSVNTGAWVVGSSAGQQTSLTVTSGGEIRNASSITLTGAGSLLRVASGGGVGNNSTNTTLTIHDSTTLRVDAGGTLGNGLITVSNNATMIFNGTKSSGTISMGNSATLIGSGSGAVTVTAVAGGANFYPGGIGTIGNLTLSNLFLNGATLNFDLQSAGGTLLSPSLDDRLTLNTALTAVGASTINVNPLTGFGAGYYMLLSGYSGTLSAASFDFLKNSITGLTGEYGKELINNPGALLLHITTVATKTWDGAVDNVWNLTTANFSGNTFADGEGAVFVDGAANTSITLTSAAGSLFPSSVHVSNSATTYTFAGAPIGGSGSLIKDGNGLLVLLNDNTLTGPVQLGGGRLQLGNGGSIGSLSGTSPIAMDGNAVLEINRSGTVTQTGMLSGTGSLLKNGSGTLQLAGNNSYINGTTVNTGTLQVIGSGSLPISGTVTVVGGTLALNATVGQLLTDGIVLGGGGSGSQARISMNATSTLSLGGAGITYVAGTNDAGASITNGYLNLGSSVKTFDIADGAADNDLTISSTLQGASNGGFIKTGAGTLYLTGTNNLIVDHNTLQAGTIKIGNDLALGSSTYFLYTIGTATIMGDGVPRSLNARIAIPSITGSTNGALTIAGSSDLTLNTIYYYVSTGNTKTLTVLNSAQTTISTLTLGTTNYVTTLVIGGTGNVNFGSIFRSPGTGDDTFNFAGTGIYNLLGASTVSGDPFVRNGTVLLNDPNSLGVSLTNNSLIGLTGGNGVAPKILSNAAITTTRGFTVLDSGPGSTVTFGGNTAVTSTFSGAITFSNDIQLSAVIGGTASFDGVLDDGGATVRGITKTGAGTVLLNGVNAYQGATTVAAGTLRLGNASALGTAVPTLYVNAGGTLDLNGFNLAATTLTDGPSGGGTITSASAAVVTVSSGTFSGILSGGSLALNKVGSGTLILAGTNTYTGPTTVAGGTLQLGNGGTTGRIASDITNSGAVVFNRSNATTYRNVVSGNGTVTIASGTVSFTGANTYTGATTVAGGTLDVIGSLGNTTVTVAAGAALVGTGTLAGPVNVLSSGTLGGLLTITAGVTSAGTIDPGSTSVGTLTLGALVLNGGFLNFQLGTSGDRLAFLAGSTAPSVLADVNFNFSLLSGFTTGTYSLFNGYAGTLSGAAFNHLLYNDLLGGFSLTLHNNAGSLDLEVGTGPSSTQIVWAGTTNNQWNTTSTNWTGDTVRFNNGVSNVTFNNTTDTNAIVVQASGVVPQNMTINNDPSHTYSFSGGAITGTGLLTKQGTGTAVFANDISFSNGVAIAGGTLRVGAGGVTGSLTGNVANSGVLAFNRSDSYTYAGLVSGSGALVQAGSGTLVLTGNQTFTGATTVQNGTLQIRGNYASTSIDVGGRTLQLFTTTNQTLTGAIAGSGFLQKLGSGTSTILGVNTFSGITSIDAGTLVVNNALSGTVYVNAGGSFTGTGSSLSYVVVQGGTGSISGTQQGQLAVSSGTTTVQSGGATTGTVAMSGGQLIVASGGSVGSTSGITVSGGTLNVQSGGMITGNGAINVGGTGILNVSGTVGQGAVAVNINAGGTLQGGHYDPLTPANSTTGAIQGSVTVNNGGKLDVGNSVASLVIDGSNTPDNTALTLNKNSQILFEFRDVTGGPGVGWDFVDLGTSKLVIDADNQSPADQIKVYINSWTLDNLGHGANNFNAAAATGWTGMTTYDWLFVRVQQTNIEINNPHLGSVGGRFLVIDDADGAGVFGLNNPYARPDNVYGKGTFKIIAGDFGSGYGLYIHYSAIPEPGSMLLAGLASLGAGWYGKRRRRQQAEETKSADDDASAPMENVG
jgi:fibronectin-binding autotransporter adhesin